MSDFWISILQFVGISIAVVIAVAIGEWLVHKFSKENQ